VDGWVQIPPLELRVARQLSGYTSFFQCIKPDWLSFVYIIQHCFICRPSDSTVSEENSSAASFAAPVHPSQGNMPQHPRPLLSRAGSGDDRGRFSSCFLILILIFKRISNHSQANPNITTLRWEIVSTKWQWKYCVLHWSSSRSYTAKTQNRKFETNIPRKGIAMPKSQFPLRIHFSVWDLFIS
jgi:hypothetical protein